MTQTRGGAGRIQQAPERAAASPSERRHLLIAGSGRTGTSFLVRYLTAAGLETHLSRRGGVAWFDEQANAGLEDFPLSKLDPDLPYVVKSPWTYELIDELLADPVIRVDAVIVPMRDLVEAAASRVVLEQRSIHQHSPWMAGLDRSWTAHGHTPGGVVYSLEPLDQARILAMGFHHLLERLVRADIPVRLLSFPRLVEDPDYLYDQLRPWLPGDLGREQARTVHRRVADRRKVRVGGELARAAQEPAAAAPSFHDLDRIALGREIERIRRQLTDAEATVRTAGAEHDQVQARLQAELEGRAGLQAEMEALQRKLDEAQAARLQEVARLQAVAENRLQALEAARSSTSWRVTAPLRAVSRLFAPKRANRHESAPNPSDLAAAKPGFVCEESSTHA